MELQFGVQTTDIIYILNTKDSVKAFSTGNFTVGDNISVAAGPTGRSSEAGASVIHTAGIYSYSKSKGLFVGISLEGTAILTRKKANADQYGPTITAHDILTGIVASPPAAEPLYALLNEKFSSILNSATPPMQQTS